MKPFKKMLKQSSVSLISTLLNRKAEKNLDINLEKKIKNLKKRDIFLRCYPITEKQPLITGYSFYHFRHKKWLDLFFSVYGEINSGFIPLPIYYQFIEPRLNNYALIAAIKDKNFYDLFLADVKTPLTVLRYINGCYYGKNYEPVILSDSNLNHMLEGYFSLILKPSIESGSGKQIVKFVRDNDQFFTDNNKVLNTVYLKNYRSDFVLQLFVNQFEFFKQFNPDSNNTVRILTYRSVQSDQTIVLHSLLRIGKKDSYLDHDNLGGIAVSIDDQGVLNDHGYDVNGIRFDSFNGVNFSRIGKVPFLNEIRRSAISIAQYIHYGRLLAMDFTVDQDANILLIEINCKGNGISQYQYSDGSLFKEYTKEILDHCENCTAKMKIFLQREQ